MKTFTLTNRNTGKTCTVQAIDSIKAKFIAAKLYRDVYPDVKGSPNSVFHWCVLA